MNRSCEKCGEEMKYMGEWPIWDRKSNITVQCHRWFCRTCKSYPNKPINEAEQSKMDKVLRFAS